MSQQKDAFTTHANKRIREIAERRIAYFKKYGKTSTSGEYYHKHRRKRILDTGV